MASIVLAGMAGYFVGQYQQLALLSAAAITALGVSMLVVQHSLTAIAFLAVYAPSEQAMAAITPLFQSGILAQGGLVLSWLVSIGLIFHPSWRPRHAVLLPVLLSLVVYLAWAIVSGIWNENNVIHVLESVQQEVRYIPLFIAISMTPVVARLATRTARTLVALVLLLIFLGWLHVFVGPDLYFFADEGTILAGEDAIRGSPLAFLGLSRFKTPFGGHVIAASFFALVFVLLPLAFWQRESQSVAARGAVVGLLIIVCILVMDSLYGVLSVIIGGAALGFMYNWRRYSLQAMAIAALVFGATVVVSLATEEDDWAQNLVLGRFRAVVSSEFIEDQSRVGRIAYYSTAADIVTADLGGFLFGVGPANWGTGLIQRMPDEANDALFRILAPRGYVLTRGQMLDSNWASMLGQVGVPGSLAFLSLLLTPLWLLLRIAHHVTSTEARVVCAVGFAVFVVYFVGGFTNAMYTSRLMSPFAWLFAGLGIQAAMADVYRSETAKT